MVFHLACLPISTFNHVWRIYEQYAHGSLKGQKAWKAKQASVKQSNLKGSNFKGIRGMDPNTVHSLLTEISERKLSLAEFASKCTSVKRMGKMQAGFVKATNCETWEDVKSNLKNSTATATIQIAEFQCTDSTARIHENLPECYEKGERNQQGG